MGFVRNPVGFGGEGPLMKGRVPLMESAPGAGCLSRLMLSASLPEIALRRHPVPGAFVGGECCVSAGEKCLQEAMAVPWLGGVPSMKYAREVGTFLGSCCPLTLPEIACGGTGFPGVQGSRLLCRGW